MAVLSSAPMQFIASTPPVTRAFTAATIVVSLVYYWLWWVSAPPFVPAYLVLVPGSSIFYPWTFVTSAFVETSIFELLFTLLTIPASLRYLERLWGSIETLKFVVVTIGVSNIIAFGLNWLEFLVLRNPTFLWDYGYHGQMALQVGVLVGFTQLIPEHQVQLFGFLKARVKTLPMAYVTLSTVMCIIGFQCPWIVIQFGWLVSWVWLRFYRKNTDAVGGIPTYGDRSETFNLVSWFPPFMHTPVGLLGNTVYSIANRVHLIPGAGPDIESGGYTQVPGGARAEAERRRAMALKALDQRLASGASTPAGRQPNGGPSASAPRPPASSNGDTPQVELASDVKSSDEETR